MILKGWKTRILNMVAIYYLVLPMFDIVPATPQPEITAIVIAVLNIINRELGTSTPAGSAV